MWKICDLNLIAQFCDSQFSFSIKWGCALHEIAVRLHEVASVGCDIPLVPNEGKAQVGFFLSPLPAFPWGV